MSSGMSSMYGDVHDARHHDNHQEDQDDQECPQSKLQEIPMYYIFFGILRCNEDEW